MTESRVSNDNYITIQGFMINDLKLKNNELLIYAIIYGFSQAENQTFSGSLQYLADWTNSTKQGVQKNIKSLLEKGLLIKTDKIINGIKFCEYSAVKEVCNKVVYHETKLHGGMQQSCMGYTTKLHGGMQQSCTNNIKDNIEDNINNIKESKKEKPTKTSFDDIIKAYAKGNEELTDLLQEWLKVRKAKRAAMTDRAITMNIEKLDSLAAASGLSVTAYLQEVICRGWAAFYEIKNYNNGNTQKPANRGANGIAINEAPSALDNVF